MNTRTVVVALVSASLMTINVCNADEFALYVAENGSVGVGTGLPEAKLHILDEEFAYNLPLTVENNSGRGFSGFRLQIAHDSFIDFNNAGGVFRINADQTPGAEFEVRPNGDASLSGALTQNSDVNSKQDIEAIDYQSVLAKVRELPVTKWSYRDSPFSRHIGPMAQDFYKSFGLGDTDRGITSIDTGGVSLAAIKGLSAEKDAEIAALKAELQAQRVEHEARMLRLEMALAEVLRNRSSVVGLAQLTDAPH